MPGDYIPPQEKFPHVTRRTKREERHQQRARKAEQAREVAAQKQAAQEATQATRYALASLIGVLLNLRGDEALPVDIATSRPHATLLGKTGLKIEGGAYWHGQTTRALWLPDTSVHTIPAYTTRVTKGGGAWGKVPSRDIVTRHPSKIVTSDTLVTLDGQVGIGHIRSAKEEVRVFETPRNCLVAVNYVFVHPEQHPAHEKLTDEIMNLIGDRLPPAPAVQEQPPEPPIQIYI